MFVFRGTKIHTRASTYVRAYRYVYVDVLARVLACAGLSE